VGVTPYEADLAEVREGNDHGDKDGVELAYPRALILKLIVVSRDYRLSARLYPLQIISRYRIRTQIADPAKSWPPDGLTISLDSPHISNSEPTVSLNRHKALELASYVLSNVVEHIHQNDFTEITVPFTHLDGVVD